MSARKKAAPALGPTERIERALRALRITGRKLVNRGSEWGVVTGTDRRRRPVARLSTSEVEQMAHEGLLTAAGEDQYVLAGVERQLPPRTEPWIYLAAGLRRSRTDGMGFIGLARKAKRGQGPLSVRQCEAGLKLVRDAELQANDTRLTMDWDAGPVDRQKRSGTAGGHRGQAWTAARRIARVREMAGGQAFELAWALCVDGEALRSIKARFGIGQRVLGPLLAAAMEAVADAYDGKR